MAEPLKWERVKGVFAHEFSYRRKVGAGWIDDTRQEGEVVEWYTYRAMVPGGWLVTRSDMEVDCQSCALTFIPDPDHAWEAQRETG